MNFCRVWQLFSEQRSQCHSANAERQAANGIQIIPCFSRYSIKITAACCGDVPVASIVSSGFSGASYGSSTPVKPIPLPDAKAARAFLYSPFGSLDSQVSI